MDLSALREELLEAGSTESEIEEALAPLIAATRHCDEVAARNIPTMDATVAAPSRTVVVDLIEDVYFSVSEKSPDRPLTYAQAFAALRAARRRSVAAAAEADRIAEMHRRRVIAADIAIDALYAGATGKPDEETIFLRAARATSRR